MDKFGVNISQDLVDDWFDEFDYSNHQKILSCAQKSEMEMLQHVNTYGQLQLLHVRQVEVVHVVQEGQFIH